METQLVKEHGNKVCRDGAGGTGVGLTWDRCRAGVEHAWFTVERQRAAT